MKNKDIHSGLDKSEVRDVIAQGLINTYEREGHVYSFSPASRLELAQEKLRIAQNNYEAVKEQEAFITIMKTFGWEEFDVSDETSKELDTKYYRSFIGSKKEYEQFIKAFNKEQSIINKF